ncbi:tetratricopeptide repeat protein [Thermodesulfobacteriota bacterium]
MIKIWKQNPKWLNCVLCALAVLALSTVRAWSIFNYSIWNADEEQIVIHALGFLDYDFNPRWFEYHTLPMYVLSALYFSAYYALLFTEVVSSNIEFASLVFTEHSYFFTSARLLFCCVHTLGCLVIAYVIAKNYKSKTGAFAFLAIVFFLPESVLAANHIRVDTFVFLFMALTIYFSCFASKNQSNFILSIVFCTAAFASKIPAIIFFPLLFAHQSYLIYRGEYPKHYLIYFILVPLISLLVFMPYMFIDYEIYFQHLERIASRASGEFLHVGKIHNFDFFSKLKAFFLTIEAQVGFVSILCSVALPVIMLIRRDRAIVICSIYVLTYCGMFPTSAFVDSYWLIPVFPYFIFFGVVLIVDFVEGILDKNTRIQTKFGLSGKILTYGTITVLLLLFGLSVLGLKPKGLIQYIDIVKSNERDTRVIAGDWIKSNLPTSSTIILDGFIQHYLPRVLSVSQNDTLYNSYFNQLGAIGRNSFLMKSFGYYYARELEENTPFNATAMVNNFRIIYEQTRMSLPLGAYVVISDSIYNRFYTENTSRVAPDVSRNAVDFYTYIKSQKHIKTFSGRGPRIDIYQLVEPSIESQYETALSLQRKGDMAASLPYLARIATLEPGYRNSLSLEGWAYQKLGRWPEAERTYLAALKHNPRHVQTRFNLAYGLMKQNRYREAINEFEEVLRIRPGYGSAHHWLGKCYEARGDAKAAADHEAIFQSTRK